MCTQGKQFFFLIFLCQSVECRDLRTIKSCSVNGAIHLVRCRPGVDFLKKERLLRHLPLRP